MVDQGGHLAASSSSGRLGWSSGDWPGRLFLGLRRLMVREDDALAVTT